ncbi:MAG TPA: FoF1 ATP synthase subunit a [Candidatus Paceibacterota bacterium]|nr:FoF1 ATP synthase subunit a [Candidatus Paceibacterota bacterium]
MEGLHITLGADTLGHFLGLPITNTLIPALMASVILLVLAFVVPRTLKMLPSKGQTLFETAIGGGFGYVEEVLGDRKLAERFFPLIATLFSFILVGNLLGFLPVVGSVGFFEEHDGKSTLVALLRPVNTDLNVTLALAIAAVVAIQVAGIATLGLLKYGSKFVNLHSVLGFAIGIIELFSELARFISFSFRLFGNMFAGKVMLLVATAFVPVFLPVPILVFEFLVGVIQAAIFALLTLFFIKIAVTEPH